MKKSIVAFLLVVLLGSMCPVAACTGSPTPGETEITFEDANLEEAVRSVLNQPEGPIT